MLQKNIRHSENLSMENLISFLQNFGGVIIGGLISLIASYLVQKQNFMYQQEQSSLQQKIAFYDNLLSKLPVQTFLSRIDEQKKSDILPELFTEKAIELSCFAARAVLFTNKEVSKKISELAEIVATGFVLNKATKDDESAQAFVAVSFFQSYQNKVNEIINVVQKEMSESAVSHPHQKEQAKVQKTKVTENK